MGQARRYVSDRLTGTRGVRPHSTRVAQTLRWTVAILGNAGVFAPAISLEVINIPRTGPDGAHNGLQPVPSVTPLPWAISGRYGRRLVIMAGAVAVLGLAIALAVFGGFLKPEGSSSTTVFGLPERGKTLATIHVNGKTGYFPGVVCQAADSEVMTVSFGVRDDPVSFYLAALLGPQTPAGTYVAPVTSLVSGHRPGLVFDQDGSGSVTVSPDLKAQLRLVRGPSIIRVGSLSFQGKDASGASLTGTVTCG